MPSAVQHGRFFSLERDDPAKEFCAGIRAAVDKGEQRYLEKAELSAVRVLEELRRIAFFDYAELFNVDGSLKDIHKMSADVWSANITSAR